MNQRDRDNLEFLLTSSPAVLKDWYYRMDAEDHQYAKHIMNLYAAELAERELTAIIDLKLLTMSSFPEAECIIDRIRRSAV